MSRRLLWIGAAALGLLAASVVAAWLLGGLMVPALPVELKPTPGLPWFEDVTTAAGIDFRHFDPATPAHQIQETLGSGVAWIDYDADGRPDLFLVQDGPIDPTNHKGPLPTSRLYRNNGDGTFRDVTAQVGLARPGFGMGAAVGDYDNDGFDDLLVTYLGEIVLFHNEADEGGGRRFRDVTATCKLADPHWATSAAWGDIDGDGFLDLYVCNYVEVDPARPLLCRHPEKGLYYQCSPTSFPLTTHRLFRNTGDGTFTDISESSGVAKAAPAPGLGVVMVDLDGDGRLDIYVANDMHPAYLFHNQGGGRFVEKGVVSGCGFGLNGNRLAGMGVIAADLDETGWPSLFVTNFQNEPNVLFLNRGGLLFQEHSYASGLGLPSLGRLGFGTVLIDADLDGRPDLVVANGHVHRTSQELFGVPSAQEAQFFHGEGGGRWQDVSDRVGSYFRQRHLGRGLAGADFDGDGRPDLAFSHCGGPAALLRNATATANGWLSLNLVGNGQASNRNAIGARVEVEAGGRKQVFFVVGGGSYLSASDRRILAGLGSAARAAQVTVTWPSGRKQVFRDLKGRWKLVEGRDQAEAENP
jgi:hypothetical protein